MKPVEIVHGALVRIDGKGNKNVGAFLQWALDNHITGYHVGSTGPNHHIGFYDSATVERITAWARATGCALTVKI